VARTKRAKRLRFQTESLPIFGKLVADPLVDLATQDELPSSGQDGMQIWSRPISGSPGQRHDPDAAFAKTRRHFKCEL
jgi:diadenosine tetraphosphatase ApaH/serine/threonine PP2A family protein phosphatase